MNNRDEAIDIAKGIAIICVIIGHLDGVNGILANAIYSFHMPLFFLVSGYLFKPSGNKESIIKNFERLVKPYLLVCGLFFLWFLILGIKYHNLDVPTRAIIQILFGSGLYQHSLIWPKIPTIGVIWFLLALFWCKVAYNIVYSYKQRYLIAGLIAVVANLLGYYVINLPLTILPGLGGLMFFMLGNFFREKKMYLNIRQKVIFLSGVLCWIVAIFYSHTLMVGCEYGCYPLDIIAGCAGTLVIYKLSIVIKSYTVYLSKVLMWFGMNSMAVLCFHFLEYHCFIWDHIHVVPNTWYYMFPAKICFVLFMSYIAYQMPYTRNLFGIQKISFKSK